MTSTGPWLDASTVAAVGSALGSIPGVHLNSASIRRHSGKRDNRPTVELYVSGWSPSLHKITMDWSAILPEGESKVDASLRSFRRRIECQRRRAKHGISVEAPLPLSAQWAQRTRVDHLYMDRAQIGFALERCRTGAFFEGMGQAIHDLHRDVRSYSGGQHIRVQDSQATDASGIAVFEGPSPRHGDLVVIGSRLRLIGRTVPMTIAMGMAGGKVGAVFQIHPRVDGRTIDKIHLDATGERPVTVIDLVPEFLPLSALAGLDQQVAIDLADANAVPAKT